MSTIIISKKAFDFSSFQLLQQNSCKSQQMYYQARIIHQLLYQYLKSIMANQSFILLLLLLSVFVQGYSANRLLSDTVVTPAASSDPRCEEAYALKCSAYSDYLRAQNPHPNCGSASMGLSEWSQRQLVYCGNCSNVAKQNNLDTYKLSYDYLDCSDAEWAAKRGIRPIVIDVKVGTANPDQIVAATLPTSLDYSNYNGKNYLSSIKNQGSCGCCWSFAATAVYESLLKLKGFSYDLSAQAALQCTSAYAPNARVSDCSGGYFPDPLTYYAKVGGVLDSKYPYLAASYGSGPGYPKTSGICTETSRIFLGNGADFVYYLFTTITQIKTLLYTYGPLMVGIYADAGFLKYKSGVYTGCPSNAASLINHAVMLYGWDSNGNWLIKNQYGTSWGMSGFMVLSNTNDCGITSAVGGIKITQPNSNPAITMDPGYNFSTAFEFYNLSVAAVMTLLMLSFFY